MLLKQNTKVTVLDDGFEYETTVRPPGSGSGSGEAVMKLWETSSVTVRTLRRKEIVDKKL